jgi:glucosamine-6-phosphate deaminase
VKTLAYDTVVANARFFQGDLSKVPRMALTVGVQTVLDSHEVMILITGAQKALALHTAVECGVSHMCTVSAFQLHPRSLFVCDDDATLELKVKTVKYFKGLMRVHNELVRDVDDDAAAIAAADTDEEPLSAQTNSRARANKS